MHENLILTYGSIPVKFITGLNKLQYKLLYDIIENALMPKGFGDVSA